MPNTPRTGIMLLASVVASTTSIACRSDDDSTTAAATDSDGESSDQDDGGPLSDGANTNTSGATSAPVEDETGSMTGGASDGPTSTTGSSMETGSTGEDAMDSGNATASGPDAPQILSLLTNVSAIDTDTVLIVSAVVSDPDGIDDVIGGQLTTSDGTKAFGSFQTTSQEGAYEITLTWDAINEVTPIDFLDVEGDELELRAQFFDQAGGIAWDTVVVMLDCVVACGDTCVAGDCHPSLQDCPGGTRCLFSTSAAAFECVAIEQPGVLEDPCQSNLECAADFWCHSPTGRCYPMYCESDADCPQLFTCVTAGGCGGYTICDY